MISRFQSTIRTHVGNSSGLINTVSAKENGNTNTSNFIHLKSVLVKTSRIKDSSIEQSCGALFKLI